MSNLILGKGNLPAIPVQMFPVVGNGISEKDLISLSNLPFEQTLNQFRDELCAERSPFRRCYYIDEKKDRVSVYYVLNLKSGKKVALGSTIKDLDAIKVLIGNSMSGAYMTSIRWELYEDPDCEDLIDMGRIDQWDLLSDISADKLSRLSADRIIAPRGDWDFDRMMFRRRCQVCGNETSVNSWVFNIDSVVCSECRNRPFLAPHISDQLEFIQENMQGGEVSDKNLFYLFDWISSVKGNFNEIGDKENVYLIENILSKTMIGEAIGHKPGRVRRLVEANSNFGFGMYQNCCAKAIAALRGDEPFSEEHQIALDFVLKTTKMIKSKALSTN